MFGFLRSLGFLDDLGSLGWSGVFRVLVLGAAALAGFTV